MSSTDQMELVIFGAGGHGRVVFDVACATGRFARIVFLDDDARKAGLTFCDCEISGGLDVVRRFAGFSFVVAIGSNHIRARHFDLLRKSGLLPAALVHPTAIVSGSAAIGSGTVVMPGAIVNAAAAIGENCIINTAAVVEHECSIADHVHICPRVALGGQVRVGRFAQVGIGAVVLPGASIGEESLVGGGALVLKEAEARRTVVGVPARTLLPTGIKSLSG